MHDVGRQACEQTWPMKTTSATRKGEKRRRWSPFNTLNPSPPLACDWTYDVAHFAAISFALRITWGYISITAFFRWQTHTTCPRKKPPPPIIIFVIVNG